MISRRKLLATAGVTALAGCAGPRVPTPTASPTGPITAQLDEVLRIVSTGTPGFGVALHDVRSGVDYRFEGAYRSQNASMAKPMIVLMALRQAAAEGTELTAARRDLATKAITVSDNDAADQLWAYAGGADAYARLASALGMTGSGRDPNRPDWSWTWTTPADQVRLLRLLAEGGTDAVSPADLRYVYDLMGQVVADQAWGVGAPKSAAVGVHLKNGWVQFKSSDGLWAVNSMGSVAGAGRDYRLAVMTRTSSFDLGREITNEVGRQVFSILGSGTL